MKARFSCTSIRLLLIFFAFFAAVGIPGDLTAAGYTDQDEEATIGDPGEQATVGDPGEQAGIGDPGEKATIGDPGEKSSF